MARPLGRMGVNTAEFCKQFNARTEGEGWIKGIEVPVRLYTFSDRTYKFEIKYPPVKDILYKLKFNITPEWFPIGRNPIPFGWIDVREIYEIAKIKMQESDKQNETLMNMAKKIAINCERMNVKVIQFGGGKPKPKLDRMFEPHYNIWTLYDENKKYWHKSDNDINIDTSDDEDNDVIQHIYKHKNLM